MPDSPKCLTCLKKSLVGQTVKVAGQQAFKCLSCKKVYKASDFTPIEFTWKQDPESYGSWLASKGIKFVS